MRRLAVCAALLAACGHDAPPPVETAALGGDIVARVGDDTIPAALVARVAAAQGTGPRAAADKLIEDALAAQGARAAGLDEAPDVHWAIASSRARLVVDRIRAAALAMGPPTDAEVAELTQRHWQAFDLPERVRVVHAVVLFPKKRSPENDRRAKEAYEALVKTVEGAADADEFEKRASALPHGSVDVRVERLPPFAADGRATEGQGSFEASFVAAAFTLQKPGALVRAETRYGWHVVQLVERLPPKTVPLEERRSTFTEEAQLMRARKAHDELLASLRTVHRVEVSPAAENLMASLSVAP